MEKELKILAESLDQKILVLKALLQYSLKQEDALKKENPELEVYDELVEKKDQLIDKLEHLDEGFESMYAKLSKGLESQKALYKPQIGDLQKKITVITGISMQIQEQESKNKQMMDDFFLKRKNQIQQSRKNSKLAYDYYKNMSSLGNVRTSILDSKQ